MKKYFFLVFICLLMGCSKEERTENSLCNKIGKELNHHLAAGISIMHSESVLSGTCTLWTKSDHDQKIYFDIAYYDDWDVEIYSNYPCYISIKTGKERHIVQTNLSLVRDVKKVRLRSEQTTKKSPELFPLFECSAPEPEPKLDGLFF